MLSYQSPSFGYVMKSKLAFDNSYQTPLLKVHCFPIQTGNLPMHCLSTCVLYCKTKFLQYQHPLGHMEDKGASYEAVPELVHNIDHSKGFSLHGVVASYWLCECLAGIVQWMHITICLFLHKCTSQCYVRCICVLMKYLVLVRANHDQSYG